MGKKLGTVRKIIPIVILVLTILSACFELSDSVCALKSKD